MTWRDIVRIAVILLVSGWLFVINAPDLTIPWHPYGVLGFTTDAYGNVTAVDPQGAKTGLRVGDRLDVKRAPLRLALAGFGSYLVYYPAGTTERVPLTSGKTLTITSHVLPRTLANDVTNEFETLAVLVFLVIASALVLLRPGAVTWAFYFFSTAFVGIGSIFNDYASVPMLVFNNYFFAIVGTASPFGLCIFALRFPDKALSHAARRFENTLLVLLAAAIATNVGAFTAFLVSRAITPDIVNSILYYSGNALIFIGMAILAVRYFTEDRVTRNRLRWIVLTFVVAFLPGMFQRFGILYLGIHLPIWLTNLVPTLFVLAPIGLAYTILKHRLFDVRFVVSRTFLYATLTSLTVGILALLDWGFGKWLEDSRFALFIELALALSIGIVMTTVHKRIEHFLNAIVFRAQTVALEGLRRFTQELDLIADPQRLLTQTHEALESRLEAEYVVIYTADGNAFVRTSTANAVAVPDVVASDDFAVLRLRRWSEPFECDVPKHVMRSALFLPMSAHTELLGFIVCGPKTDHTRYSPDEVATLASLTHRVGTAYAWLTRLQHGATVTTGSLPAV